MWYFFFFVWLRETGSLENRNREQKGKEQAELGWKAPSGGLYLVVDLNASLIIKYVGS